MEKLTRAERQAVIRLRRRQYQRQQLGMWWRKDVKPIVIILAYIALFFNIFAVLFWGSCFDSENINLVFKNFCLSVVLGVIDCTLLWIIGGVKL